MSPKSPDESRGAGRSATPAGGPGGAGPSGRAVCTRAGRGRGAGAAGRVALAHDHQVAGAQLTAHASDLDQALCGEARLDRDVFALAVAGALHLYARGSVRAHRERVDRDGQHGLVGALDRDRELHRRAHELSRSAAGRDRDVHASLLDLVGARGGRDLCHDARGLDPEVGLLDCDPRALPHQLGVGERERGIDRKARVADRHDAARDGIAAPYAHGVDPQGERVEEENLVGRDRHADLAGKPRDLTLGAARLLAGSLHDQLLELVVGGVAHDAQPPGGESDLAASTRQRPLCARPVGPGLRHEVAPACAHRVLRRHRCVQVCLRDGDIVGRSTDSRLEHRDLRGRGSGRNRRKVALSIEQSLPSLVQGCSLERGVGLGQSVVAALVGERERHGA